MCFLVALIIVTVIVIIIVVVLIVIVIITFRNLFHVLAGGVELERALFLLDCEVNFPQHCNALMDDLQNIGLDDIK